MFPIILQKNSAVNFIALNSCGFKAIKCIFFSTMQKESLCPGLIHGNGHHKLRALFQLGSHMDGSLVEIHDVLYDGQAKARTALFAAAPLVHPGKTVQRYGPGFPQGFPFRYPLPGLPCCRPAPGY